MTDNNAPFPEAGNSVALGDQKEILAGPGNAAISQAAENAISTATGRRKIRSDAGQSRGPRTARSDSGGTSGTQPKPSPELQREIQRQIEYIYNAKTWAALATLPADVALATTGNGHWKVSDAEKETLGESCAVAARFLVLENPKTLAVIMASAAFFSVYAPRIQQEIKLRSEKKNADEPKPK